MSYATVAQGIWGHSISYQCYRIDEIGWACCVSNLLGRTLSSPLRSAMHKLSLDCYQFMTVRYVHMLGSPICVFRFLKSALTHWALTQGAMEHEAMMASCRQQDRMWVSMHRICIWHTILNILKQPYHCVRILNAIWSLPETQVEGLSFELELTQPTGSLECAIVDEILNEALFLNRSVQSVYQSLRTHPLLISQIWLLECNLLFSSADKLVKEANVKCE